MGASLGKAEDGDIGSAVFLGIGPHAAFDKREVLHLFKLRRVAIQDGVGNLVGSRADGDGAEAGLKILIRQFRIDGKDVGKAAHGDAIVPGELFAVQLLGGGALAERLELKAPEVIGAERFYEGIDVGIEAVDGGRDEDDGRDADGDAEDGEAGTQLVLAQGLESHFYGFF
jgi:hypothetical protein